MEVVYHTFILRTVGFAFVGWLLRCYIDIYAFPDYTRLYRIAGHAAPRTRCACPGATLLRTFVVATLPSPRYRLPHAYGFLDLDVFGCSHCGFPLPLPFVGLVLPTLLPFPTVPAVPTCASHAPLYTLHTGLVPRLFAMPRLPPCYDWNGSSLWIAVVDLDCAFVPVVRLCLHPTLGYLVGFPSSYPPPLPDLPRSMGCAFTYMLRLFPPHVYLVYRTLFTHLHTFHIPHAWLDCYACTFGSTHTTRTHTRFPATHHFTLPHGLVTRLT